MKTKEKSRLSLCLFIIIIFSLPNLQFDFLSVDFDYSRTEFNTNRMWAIGHKLNNKLKRYQEKKIDEQTFFSVN